MGCDFIAKGRLSLLAKFNVAASSTGGTWFVSVTTLYLILRRCWLVAVFNFYFFVVFFFVASAWFDTFGCGYANHRVDSFLLTKVARH